MADSYTWHPGGYLNASFQSDPYEYAAQQASGIRTVLPSELLNRKTPEQEQEEYNKQLEIQSRELDLQNKRLKQQTDLDKITYDKNVVKQGQDFLTEIKNLNPSDPDYTVHKAALIDRMPLAIQHDAVKYQLGNLDKTNESLRQNRANVEEHQRQTGVTQKQQDLTKARDWAAQKGARYLQQFQETLKNNPDADPVSVIAQIVDSQEEQKSISELRRHEIPEEEINKFRVPEVNANGQPTGRTIYNKEAADTYLKTFPTNSNLNAATNQRMKLRQELANAPDDDTKKQIQEDLDITNRIIARYNQKLGEGKTVKEPAGSNVTTRPTSPKDFFKSKASASAEIVETKAPNELTQEDIQAAAEDLYKKRKAKEASEAALKEQQAAQASYNW